MHLQACRMPSSGRISLHDCTVELRMPALSSLPSSSAASSDTPPSLGEVALSALEYPVRELTGAYLGETVVLVVTVRGPDAPAESARDALFFALERLCETRVFLSAAPATRPPAASRNALRRPDSAPRSQQGPSLPVLCESEWVAARQGAAFAKALCVLLRTPPENSRPHHLAAARGRMRLLVTLRDRASLSEAALSRASAAISRAARVVGRPLALSAAKVLAVRIPLEVRCTHFTAGGSAAKAFIAVAATNVSPDAVLSVVPPFVHVTASKVVRETTQKGRIRVAQVKEVPIPAFDVNTGTYLDEAFEFVPCFEDTAAESDSESEAFAEDGAGAADRRDSADAQEAALGVERQSSAVGDELAAGYDEDLGLFIPSFNVARKRAVTLQPHEEFNFVYAISSRGCTTFAELPPAASVISTSTGASMNLSAKKGASVAASFRALPRLAPGTAFETAVAVAWSCASSDAVDAAAALPLPSLERAFSSGGVLALGRRRSVAVRVVAVQWRPPALVEDVVVSFAGPCSAALRGHVPVTVTVRNQGRKDLNAAALYVQRGPPGEHARLLTPLRTAISLGRVPAGGSARVELLCVALQCGALTLGEVKVVDLEAEGADPAEGVPVWCAENSFEVFVVESETELQTGGQSVVVGGFE